MHVSDYLSLVVTLSDRKEFVYFLFKFELFLINMRVDKKACGKVSSYHFSSTLKLALECLKIYQPIFKKLDQMTRL